MIKEGVAIIPVLEGKKVVGIIRLSDLFREISEVVRAE